MKQLNREILSLAAPSILANITVPLVGMADIAVASHLGGGTGAAALIGGITIGTMLFDLLYWNFAFLRSGTGGLTAQAYGRLLADSDGVDQVQGILLRALRIAMLSGVALIALQWVVLWLAFLLVDCTPEVRELASEYFKIRIWAAPATLSLFAFKGWFIGLQDTVKPMIADLLVNGLNIFYFTILIYYLLLFRFLLSCLFIYFTWLITFYYFHFLTIFCNHLCWFLLLWFSSCFFYFF